MSLVRRTDYVAAALGRLPRQFRGKPRLEAILSAFAEASQELERGMFTLYAPRFLENAAGDMLDVYGALVGQARGGLDDASFRIRIQARMILNRSSGTAEDILAIARLLVGPGNTLTLREPPPAAMTLQVAGGATPFPDDLYAILYSAKAGGVSFRLITQAGADADRFVFAGGVGKGWGSVPADWVGQALQVQPGTTAPSLSPVTTVANTSGAGVPAVSITDASLVPSDMGTVTMTVTFDRSQYSWVSDNGLYGNDNGLNLDNDGNPATPEPMLDEFSGTAVPVGISVLWADDAYNTGDAFRFTVNPPQPMDSTAPVVAASGALTAAATGRWTFKVTTAAPGFWFTYTRPDGSTSSAMSMNRGTPVVLRDAALNPVGLTVTWPNVSTYYVNAQHTVRAHRGTTVVGGRWVSVR